MTAALELPDPAEQTIAGERAAKRCLHAVQDGFAAPDRLMHDLLDVLAEDGKIVAPSPRLRGFCRQVGKALEAAPRRPRT